MIRQATNDDVLEIIELYKAGLDELGYNDYEEDRLIKKVTESFVLAPCFLVVKDDIITGMAGMTLVITSHNGVATLVDYMVYVKPEYRNIKILSGLMDEIKRFADAHNFPVKLEFICNNDEELRKRLFKRCGFKVQSVTGIYNDT